MQSYLPQSYKPFLYLILKLNTNNKYKTYHTGHKNVNMGSIFVLVPDLADFAYVMCQTCVDDFIIISQQLIASGSEYH